MATRTEALMAATVLRALRYTLPADWYRNPLGPRVRDDLRSFQRRVNAEWGARLVLGALDDDTLNALAAYGGRPGVELPRDRQLTNAEWDAILATVQDRHLRAWWVPSTTASTGRGLSVTRTELLLAGIVLRALGYRISPLGRWDATMRANLRRFQAAANREQGAALRVDGVLGNDSLNALSWYGMRSPANAHVTSQGLTPAEWDAVVTEMEERRTQGWGGG